MKKFTFIVLFSVISSVCLMAHDFIFLIDENTNPYSLYQVSVSQKSKPSSPSGNFRIGLGMGLGLPYGVIGGKLAASYSIIEGNVGFGIVPLAWAPSFAIGGSIYLLPMGKLFRPKISAALTNTAAFIYFMDENLSTLFHEEFAGIGGYLGCDLQPFEGVGLAFDANLGFTYPFIGKDELIDRYWEEKGNLEEQGYTFENDDEPKNVIFPKVSLGLVYYFNF